MPKYGRLSHTSEFAKVYKNAKKWHCYDASVYFLAADEFRFAVVASKKIGIAVARNRAKRRLRAIFSELASTAKLGDYVIIAKDSLLSSKYSQASKNIRWALKKIGALQ